MSPDFSQVTSHYTHAGGLMTRFAIKLAELEDNRVQKLFWALARTISETQKFLQVIAGAQEVHTLLPSSIMDPSTLRKKFERFRILIIGRANAGKTTILQRVCKTRENPEIYNSAGKEIDPAVLMASRERGVHDIENEMVFRSNPGFYRKPF